MHPKSRFWESCAVLLLNSVAWVERSPSAGTYGQCLRLWCWWLTLGPSWSTMEGLSFDLAQAIGARSKDARLALTWINAHQQSPLDGKGQLGSDKADKNSFQGKVQGGELRLGKGMTWRALLRHMSHIARYPHEHHHLVPLAWLFSSIQGQMSYFIQVQEVEYAVLVKATALPYTARCT